MPPKRVSTLEAAAKKAAAKAKAKVRAAERAAAKQAAALAGVRGGYDVKERLFSAPREFRQSIAAAKTREKLQLLQRQFRTERIDAEETVKELLPRVKSTSLRAVLDGWVERTVETKRTLRAMKMESQQQHAALDFCVQHFEIYDLMQFSYTNDIRQVHQHFWMEGAPAVEKWASGESSMAPQPAHFEDYDPILGAILIYEIWQADMMRIPKPDKKHALFKHCHVWGVIHHWLDYRIRKAGGQGDLILNDLSVETGDSRVALALQLDSEGVAQAYATHPKFRQVNNVNKDGSTSLMNALREFCRQDYLIRDLIADRHFDAAINLVLQRGSDGKNGFELLCEARSELMQGGEYDMLPNFAVVFDLAYSSYFFPENVAVWQDDVEEQQDTLSPAVKRRRCLAESTFLATSVLSSKGHTLLTALASVYNLGHGSDERIEYSEKLTVIAFDLLFNRGFGDALEEETSGGVEAVHKASLFSCDEQGNTVLHWARLSGFTLLEAVLRTGYVAGCPCCVEMLRKAGVTTERARSVTALWGQRGALPKLAAVKNAQGKTACELKRMDAGL